jgi:hypothetical protein
VNKEKKSMKKVLIIGAIVILIGFVLLCPTKKQLKDGGTVVYEAVLYTVYDMHSYRLEGLEVGTIVEILGFEVYNDTEIVKRIDYEN